MDCLVSQALGQCCNSSFGDAFVSFLAHTACLPRRNVNKPCESKQLLPRFTNALAGHGFRNSVVCMKTFKMALLGTVVTVSIPLLVRRSA